MGVLNKKRISYPVFTMLHHQALAALAVAALALLLLGGGRLAGAPLVTLGRVGIRLQLARATNASTEERAVSLLGLRPSLYLAAVPLYDVRAFVSADGPLLISGLPALWEDMIPPPDNITVVVNGTTVCLDNTPCAAIPRSIAAVLPRSAAAVLQRCPPGVGDASDNTTLVVACISATRGSYPEILLPSENDTRAVDSVVSAHCAWYSPPDAPVPGAPPVLPGGGETTQPSALPFPIPVQSAVAGACDAAVGPNAPQGRYGCGRVNDPVWVLANGTEIQLCAGALTLNRAARYGQCENNSRITTTVTAGAASGGRRQFRIYLGGLPLGLAPATDTLIDVSGTPTVRAVLPSVLVVGDCRRTGCDREVAGWTFPVGDTEATLTDAFVPQLSVGLDNLLQIDDPESLSGAQNPARITRLRLRFPSP